MTAASGSGHRVQTDNLRSYADKLAAGADKTTEVKSLVAQADVGDESWGVVGLFVKQQYSTLLNDLNDLLDEMVDGYNQGNENFMNAATEYDNHEAGVADAMHQLTQDVDIEIASI